MEKKITLPRLGETMEKGNISKWLIKEDETFERGQTIHQVYWQFWPKHRPLNKRQRMEIWP